MTARSIATYSPDPIAWRHATMVFVVFLAAQVIDGVLTYVGVSVFGLHVEANPLLSTSMHAMGAPRALLSSKLLACVCGYILYRTAFHRPLAITAGLCVGVAVVPWLGVVGRLLIAP